MFRFAGLIVLLSLIFPFKAVALDTRFEGRTRLGGFVVFDGPRGFHQYDAEAELRLGLVGAVLEGDEWILDYEVIGDLRHEAGALEQAGLAQTFDPELFRGWIRLDKENFKLRGGRQQILFGAGTLFRPLGFFDTRIISGVIPQTNGVDGLRATYFPTASTLIESWVVPAKNSDRMITGGRIETQLGIFEAGIAAQYKPVSDIRFLSSAGQELTQVGYHLKGEKTIGFWNESRLDFEQRNSDHFMRFQSVLGADYTFDVGEGLHVLVEYLLTTQESGFTLTDPKGNRTLHQMGFQMDQPVGINTVWRTFVFFDMLDRSFQIVPQLEYALTDQTFLYLQGQFGGSVLGNDTTGRLFRDGSVPNGTEHRLGLTLITFF